MWCGPGVGVGRVEVEPCSGVWRVEVDKGGAYFSPRFRSIGEEDDFVVRWGQGEDPIRVVVGFDW